MFKFAIKFVILTLLALSSTLSALDQQDRLSIQEVIKGYVASWNERAGVGFGEGFTEDADFVNIMGMCFKGREEIEIRHMIILKTFLKDSKMEILDTQLREAQPGLVIALVKWKVDHFRTPGTDLNQPGVIREGVFTHVFIKPDKKWEITATQNTLIPL